MSFIEINRLKLFYEVTGSGRESLFFVHGSWVDHQNWEVVVPLLSSPGFRLITYDRRGHSQSERPEAQGNAQEDASDLRALIEQLASPPVHLIGNSFGAIVILKLAASNPELIKSAFLHEPPLFRLLDPALVENIQPRVAAVLELIKTGERREAAKQFVETLALGPGSWDQLTPEEKEICTFNADTFLDEVNDPDGMIIDVSSLERFDRPIVFTRGDQSPPFFELILGKLMGAIKHARLQTFAGAGHIPHVTHAREYSNAIREFILA